MSKFVILRDVNGLFYFELETENGRVILTGESHINKHLCIRNIEAVKANISNDRYYSKDSLLGGYYFRLKARNGHVICLSPNYKNKAKMEKGIECIKINAPGAAIVEQFSRKTRIIQRE